MRPGGVRTCPVLCRATPQRPVWPGGECPTKGAERSPATHAGRRTCGPAAGRHVREQEVEEGSEPGIRRPYMCVGCRHTWNGACTARAGGGRRQETVARTTKRAPVSEGGAVGLHGRQRKGGRGEDSWDRSSCAWLQFLRPPPARGDKIRVCLRPISYYPNVERWVLVLLCGAAPYIQCANGLPTAAQLAYCTLHELTIGGTVHQNNQTGSSNRDWQTTAGTAWISLSKGGYKTPQPGLPRLPAAGRICASHHATSDME